jgi:hypothetical protein
VIRSKAGAETGKYSQRVLKANVLHVLSANLCLKTYRINESVFTILSLMQNYIPTAKGYFSGCGGMEMGIMQAGINVVQSLDLDR